jgi:hypothetical protein
MPAMKTSITILACVLLSAASHQACAQDTGPRDLYNTYGKSEHAASPSPSSTATPSMGRPGARVRVELDRGGKARFVSAKTVFRAGDKVRFHFAMNFPGYVAIVNQGSSGKRSLLFPYEGVSGHIGRTADYTVPQGEGWFEFDDTPGTEQLTFVMSKREIEEVTQVTVGTHTTPPAAPPASQPAVAPPVAEAAPAIPPPPASPPDPQTEEQEILAALNSRSLDRGRDLKMVEENNDGYVLTTEQALEKPVGFKLTLTHH